MQPVLVRCVRRGSRRNTDPPDEELSTAIEGRCKIEPDPRWQGVQTGSGI